MILTTNLLLTLTTLSLTTASILPPYQQHPLQHPLPSPNAIHGSLPRYGYICPPVQGRHDNLDYSVDDIQRAATESVVSRSISNSEYPHPFANYNNFTFPPACHAPGIALQEYPLLRLIAWRPHPDPKKRGDPRYRMDPGGDRVIVSFGSVPAGDVLYCGVVHHIKGSQFGRCTEKKR